jgi:hypothetical protein
LPTVRSRDAAKVLLSRAVARLAKQYTTNVRRASNAGGTNVTEFRLTSVCHLLPRAGTFQERPQLSPKAGVLLGSGMPRYHFDLVDSKTIADGHGRELPDDAMAELVAKEIAARLREERPELRGRNFAVLATDQDGERICRVPVDLLN